eukprot:3380576-Ditylum_brightwellii.AAC.1
MSAAQTSMLFSAAYVKAILTLSLDTKPAYVDPTGSGVLCPSRTHLDFLKDDVSRDHVPPNWCLRVVFQDLKGDSYISDLLPYSILPECVPVFRIYFISM